MENPVPIKKAVFPVAGMGTRFLPATKASPKEMLPIVDKPLIQYAVEEAVAAGCTELVFVTGRNKRSIEDHFDKAYELETELEQRHKTSLLSHVRDILPPDVTCLYIRQAEALGLGHAVLCARAAVGNEPFAVILADDLIDAPQGAIAQMAEVYRQTGNSVLGVETVAPSQTGSYGIVEVSPWQQYQRIQSIVEKPKPEEAPSNLAVVGRYILTPRIFSLLQTVGRGAGGEIDGAGQDEVVVVVGVFADQVHPPRGEPDSLRFGSRQLLVAGGQLLNSLHRSPFPQIRSLLVGRADVSRCWKLACHREASSLRPECAVHQICCLLLMHLHGTD